MQYIDRLTLALIIANDPRRPIWFMPAKKTPTSGEVFAQHAKCLRALDLTHSWKYSLSPHPDVAANENVAFKSCDRCFECNERLEAPCGTSTT